MSKIQFNIELDCRGLNCPLPILKTKKAIDSMSSGEILKMTSTDPSSNNDIIAWAKKTGNKILLTENQDDDFIFLIRKSK